MHEREATVCDTNREKQELLAGEVRDLIARGVTDTFDIAIALRGHGDKPATLPEGLEEHDFDGVNIDAAKEST